MLSGVRFAIPKSLSFATSPFPSSRMFSSFRSLGNKDPTHVPPVPRRPTDGRRGVILIEIGGGHAGEGARSQAFAGEESGNGHDTDGGGAAPDPWSPGSGLRVSVKVFCVSVLSVRPRVGFRR